MNTRTWWSIGGIITALAGCGSVPPVVRYTPPAVAESAVRDPIRFDDPRHAEQVVLYAYGLLGTGYQFGGRNPEAGLDCSGMVSYIVEQVSGKRLPHNAARIAAQTRSVERDDLQPGDLVFFNTLNPFAYGHLSGRGEVHPCSQQPGRGAHRTLGEPVFFDPFRRGAYTTARNMIFYNSPPDGDTVCGIERLPM